ncbi:MAG: hypothetical protein IJS32_09395, partial [Kiritimatiellae bacterium]|nr:hypothetical protein [Kiritimatiellia bacterium]
MELFEEELRRAGDENPVDSLPEGDFARFHAGGGGFRHDAEGARDFFPGNLFGDARLFQKVEDGKTALD